MLSEAGTAPKQPVVHHSHTNGIPHHRVQGVQAHYRSEFSTCLDFLASDSYQRTWEQNVIYFHRILGRVSCFGRVMMERC